MRKLTNSGFSLVEIMIATGILAVALLAIMQAGGAGATSGKNQTLDLDFNILISNLQTTLSTDCSRLVTAQTKAFVNQPTPNPDFGPLQIGSFVIAAVPSPGSNPVGLVVTSIALDQTPSQIAISQGGNVEYQTNLNIQATKITSSGKPFPGAPNLHKDFPLNVWVNPSTSQIVGCGQGDVPTGATLSVTPGCQGTTSIVTAQWNCANPASVTSAEMALTGGAATPLPAFPSPTAIPVTPGGPYTYTLLLTDQSGVQSYGVASPSPTTVANVPPCSP